MFSPKVLRIIRSSIKFMEKTHLFPFSWDDAGNSMIETRSKFTIVYTNVFCLHYPLYILFTLIQLLKSVRSVTQESVMDTYWLIMMTVGFIMITATVYGPLVKRQVQVACFNQIVSLDGMMTSKQIYLNSLKSSAKIVPRCRNIWLDQRGSDKEYRVVIAGC